MEEISKREWAAGSNTIDSPENKKWELLIAIVNTEVTGEFERNGVDSVGDENLIKDQKRRWGQQVQWPFQSCYKREGRSELGAGGECRWSGGFGGEVKWGSVASLFLVGIERSLAKNEERGRDLET